MSDIVSTTAKIGQATTLREVASLAGVSLATASRALNGHSGRQVSSEKAQRIREAARTLRYQPNRAAQQLGRVAGALPQRTRNIGLILDAETRYSDPFWSEVLDGVADELLRQRYQLRFTFNGEDLLNEHQRQLLSPLYVDGLLLLGNSLLVDRLTDIECPRHLVLVLGEDRTRWEMDQRFDVVTMEKQAAIDQLVEHLVERGRRHLGYVGPPAADDRRGIAFANALARLGLPLEQALVLDSRFSLEGGYRAAGGLFAGAHPRVDGLVCACDTIAIGVVRAAREHGLVLPRDLAVTGFDDVAMAQHVDPPLTTVHVPKLLMGKLAARKLVERITGSDLPPIISLVPTHLIVRASTGAA